MASYLVDLLIVAPPILAMWFVAGRTVYAAIWN